MVSKYYYSEDERQQPGELDFEYRERMRRIKALKSVYGSGDSSGNVSSYDPFPINISTSDDYSSSSNSSNDSFSGGGGDFGGGGSDSSW